MKLSARNVLPATVKSVTPGAVDSEVIVGARARNRGGRDHHQAIGRDSGT